MTPIQEGQKTSKARRNITIKTYYKLNRYIKVVLISLVFHLCYLQSSLARETEYPELPLKDMRITAYTKDFAKRFGLPDPVPGTEPSGGLEAIEFAIEKGKFAPYYYCNFYLYFNKNIPIKYPLKGDVGEKDILISGTHFFGRTHDQWMKWSLQDRRYSSGLEGNYNRKANLASMNYIPNKQGAISDLYYREFHKNILPGLSYIKLDCSPPTLMITEARKNIGIWLQKESKTDYRRHIQINQDDFLKFKIPDHIFEKVREWGFRAKTASDKIDQLLRKKPN